MITIKNTKFSSNIDLAAMLMVRTKAYMLDICKKLDLYVSPNLKKDETARRIAQEILDNPLAVLCSLGKEELQKYTLILTYEDVKAGEWKMLMPDSVRESLSVSLPAILSLAEKTGKVPTYKDLRMLSFLNSLYGGEKES